MKKIQFPLLWLINQLLVISLLLLTVIYPNPAPHPTFLCAIYGTYKNWWCHTPV